MGDLEIKSRLNFSENTIELPYGEISPTQDLLLESVRYFIERFLDSSKKIRVLEIGANPMNYQDYIMSFFKVISANLSKLENVIVCANDIYEPKAIDWERAKFVLGDFNSNETQEKILDYLGGESDLILGQYVFISDIGKYQIKNRLPLNYNEFELADRIGENSYSFLKEGGHMIIHNGKSNYLSKEKLPLPLKNLPLSHFFWNTKVQVINKK